MYTGIFNFFKIKHLLGLLVCNLTRSWLFLQYSVSSDAHVWTLLQQWLRVPAIVSLIPVPAILGVSPLISFPNYQPDRPSSVHKTWREAPDWARMATMYYLCNSSIAATLQRNNGYLFSYLTREPKCFEASMRGTVIAIPCGRQHFVKDRALVEVTYCNQRILQFCVASLQKSHTVISVVHLGGRRGR